MIRLYFRTWGSGEPLIILHGLFGSSDNWASVGGALAGHYRVFALDQRNHGQSPHTDEINYDVLACDVYDFMDQQGLTRAHLLGHSMGGKAAMYFALRHPSRVQRLIVVDIAPRAYPPWHREILRALAALRLPEFDSRAEIDAGLAKSIPEKAVRQFLLKSVSRGPSGFAWKLNLTALERNYDHLNAAVSSDEQFCGSTLFIAGDQSDYIKTDDRRAILAQFPRAEFCRIPNAGHWVHAENLPAFLACVNKFLGSRETSASEAARSRS